ncbi:MAG: RNA-directed DNA polymerase [Polyangiaceae bacterium]|nr:RNA-directed DNA polymerase [Polyangiaceae bacterium]
MPPPPPRLPISALLRAVEVAARGKRRSRDVAAFLLDGERAAAELGAELAAARWAPGIPRGFVIHEPKRRVISALPFRDRVVQHLLVGATLPSLERHAAPQSYACREGRGTHACLRRAAACARRSRWALRLDYAKFFHSVDHAVLLELLEPHTPPEWRAVTRAVLDGPAHLERVDFRFPGDDLFTPLDRRRGLPVGNLTSQVWANLMLTPIDHLLASHLGLGRFVRYCDDLLVFDDDPGRLRAAWDAVRARSDALRLRLHPTKCRLHRTTEAVAFLGFVLRREGDAVSVRLQQENVRRFRRRIAESRRLLAAGALEPSDLLAQLRAWLAHARHGHTRALVARELQRLARDP